jgi:serine protease
MIVKYVILAIFALVGLILTGCNSSDDSGTDVYYTTLNIDGKVLVGSNIAVDDDVNDVRAPALGHNNTTSTAQFIPNPVILGGYVNRPNTGEDGNSYMDGDTDDFFQVDLRAGQVINLFVANENLFGNDLDLGLRDSEGAILDASVGEGATETLVVPADGHYFVQVQASLGASNYILSIGQDTTAITTGLRLSDDFASGEVLVQFAAAEMMSIQSTLTSLGLQAESQDTSRRMLFTLDFEALHPLVADNMKFATPKLQQKYETLLAVKELRRQTAVVEANPNYQFHLLTTPNDELFHYQWNHSQLNLPQAWDITQGDPSVVVAVIDTGVLLDHPDLQNKTVEGFDFIKNIRISQDGDGLDPNPDDPGDQLPGGSSFHGTHVAGTIAAVTNNKEGIAGVSWFSKIMPLRVIGKGGLGLDYDIEQAIRYAAGLPNDSGRLPAQPADIINLSLGGPAISTDFQQLIEEVQNKGIIIVAAAGNEDTDTPVFPAALDGVIAVGAVDMDKQRASYSNYGSYIDVVAPGGDHTPDINGDGMPDGILSTVGAEIGETRDKQKIEFTFASSVGTSMASPHVAGVISLMKAVYSTLTPQETDRVIMSGTMTEDLGIVGRDNDFGYGLVNAQKAVLAALELNNGELPPPPPPFLIVTPSSLNFGLSRSSATIKLTNSGGGDLIIENITENSGGFLSIEGNGLGEYVVSVNRNLLTTGTFTATITITSSANTVKVPVILQMGDPNLTGDAGYHYILLIDSNSSNTIQQITASVYAGNYNYRFIDVPAGDYIIAAGSDFNNDGFICDVGEACGAYLTSDRPITLKVKETRFGIDFNTGFDVNFMSKTALSMDNPIIPKRGFALLKPKRISHR